MMFIMYITGMLIVASGIAYCWTCKTSKMENELNNQKTFLD